MRFLWPPLQDWIFALTLLVPIYCTNGAPVIFGGGRPIDSGKSLPDGQRILGDHKTLRGFASGMVVGGIVGFAESIVLSQNLLILVLLASLGALLGDMAGAFTKRRLGIKPGGPFPVLDQLDFVVGAILMVSLVSDVSMGAAMIVLLVTPPIHFLTNVGAYVLGLKSTYW